MKMKIKQIITIIVASVMNLFCAGVGNFFIGQKKAGIIYIVLDSILSVIALSILFNPSSYTIIGFIFILFYLFCILSSIIHLIVYYRKTCNRLQLTIKVFLVCSAILLLNSKFSDIIFEKTKEHYRSNIETVYGNSMENSFFSGDYCLFQKRDIYQRGDSLAISRKGIDIIKRLIAFEGDSVLIKSGRVYVNGKEINEENIKKIVYKNQGDPKYGVYKSYVVPNGCVYVLGDNSSQSNDSRYFGAVPLANIKGKIVKVIWPINRISNK